MKGLFIGMEWFPSCRDGGLNRYFYEEILALSEKDIRGTALVSDAPECQKRGIAVRSIGRPGASLGQRFKGVRKETGSALESGVDFISSHFALYLWPVVAKLSRRLPAVMHFHGPWADEILAESRGWKAQMRAFLARRIERVVYTRAARVITLSEAFRDIAHHRYGIPVERIQVIPGGADLGRYMAAPVRSEARGRLGWPKGRPIILSVRRLARRMGLDQLIEAVGEVRRAVPDVLLLIGGKGPERETLERQIQARGLQDNVRLLGFISDDDLPLAYAAADLSIVPTTALEGFGLITVESLAAGTPVLGTRVGGTAEILGGLDRTLLIDTPSASAIAERLMAVLRGQTALPDTATCKAYAMQYDWSVVLPKIEAVYQRSILEAANYS